MRGQGCCPESQVGITGASAGLSSAQGALGSRPLGKLHLDPRSRPLKAHPRRWVKSWGRKTPMGAWLCPLLPRAAGKPACFGLYFLGDGSRARVVILPSAPSLSLLMSDIAIT